MLARRWAALAAVALVGALGAIALSRLDDDPDTTTSPPTAVVRVGDGAGRDLPAGS